MDKSSNVVIMNSFYKVIVLEVNVLETEIIDERHFATEMEGRLYAESQERKGYIPVLVQMKAEE